MDSELMRLYKNLLSINSEQCNQLRKVYREKMNLEKHVEERFYFEITRMNNELINAKRDLEKKNMELKLLNEKLNDLVTKDYLTGLYNRRYFYQNIENEIMKAKRIGYSISLIMIDFNNFKKVNDTLGHETGDKLLQDFANICNRTLRKDFDIVIRFGGDEFIIVLLNCVEENALEVAMRLEASFSQISSIASLAYGIVEIKHTDNIKIENYLKIIDKKMYDDKAIKNE